MFELVFGLIWTAFSLLFVVIAFSAGGISALPVLGIMGIFIAVGVFLIVRGGKQVVKDYKTKKNGDEVYGMVIEICPSGASVNDRPIMNADVVIAEVHGGVGVYTDTIGTDRNKYRIGDFLIVKHYDDDINIVSRVDEDMVPEDIRIRIMTSGYVQNYIEQVPPMYGADFNQRYGGAYQNYNQGYNQGYQNYNQGYGAGGYNQPGGQSGNVIIDGVEYVNDPMDNSYYNNTDNSNSYNDYNNYN